MMFWLSSPDYFLAFPNREALAADRREREHRQFRFSGSRRSLEQRLYTRSNIAYAPLSHVVENYRAPRRNMPPMAPGTVGDDIAVRRASMCYRMPNTASAIRTNWRVCSAHSVR
jgi:hypothetical protein